MVDVVGTVKEADDDDYMRLREMCRDHDGWRQDFTKGATTVWTRSNDISDFRMVKIRGIYTDITAEVMYDVIHDPVYRKSWDPNILEGTEICRISDNSDIGYYAMQLPRPLSNRDFVTQRSWRDLGVEKLIINHSVNHAAMPPKRYFIRGVSYLTGYYIRATGLDASRPGCELTYITQADPKGNLPVWVVNKSTQWLAPKVISRLEKACNNYPDWKKDHDPSFKPWRYPEQSTLPMLKPGDILTMSATNGSLASECKEGDVTYDQLNGEHMDSLKRIQ